MRFVVLALQTQVQMPVKLPISLKTALITTLLKAEYVFVPLHVQIVSAANRIILHTPPRIARLAELRAPSKPAGLATPAIHKAATAAFVQPAVLIK